MPSITLRLRLRQSRPSIALLLVRAFSFILRLLPLRAVLPLGRLLGQLARAALPFRRSVVRANLVATGYAADDVDLERRAYEHAGSALLIALLPSESSARLLSYTPSLLRDEFEADCRLGGVIVCSAHVGVWELVPAALSRHLPERARRHGVIVYRPLHDESLDRWLRCHRRSAAAGLTLMAADGCCKALRRSLALGGLVGLVADQRPASGRASVAAELLGQQSEFSPGLVALHRSTGAPVWFAAVIVDSTSPTRTCLRLHLERLAPRAGTPTASTTTASTMAAADKLVQCYADAVTRMVRTAPEQFYWFHRRFTSLGRRHGKAG